MERGPISLLGPEGHDATVKRHGKESSVACQKPHYASLHALRPDDLGRRLVLGPRQSTTPADLGRGLGQFDGPDGVLARGIQPAPGKDQVAAGVGIEIPGPRPDGLDHVAGLVGRLAPIDIEHVARQDRLAVKAGLQGMRVAQAIGRDAALKGADEVPCFVGDHQRSAGLFPPGHSRVLVVQEQAGLAVEGGGQRAPAGRQEQVAGGHQGPLRGHGPEGRRPCGCRA